MHSIISRLKHGTPKHKNMHKEHYAFFKNKVSIRRDIPTGPNNGMSQKTKPKGHHRQQQNRIS